MRVPRQAAALFLALVSPAVAGWGQQAPTCRRTLDSLDARLRQNYAGFLLEVRGERRAAYNAMVASAGTRADATGLTECYPVLAGYIAWYNDPHLFVFQSQSTDSATARQRAEGLPRVPVSDAAVRTALDGSTGKRDPIEGIWYDGPLRIAVVPDPEGQDGDFLGVVLRSDTSAWPAGAVRARFRRESEGVYATRLLTRGFAEMTLVARIHKRVMLRLSPGIWGRAFPLAAPDTGLIDTVDVHRPRVSIRRKSVLVSIPSHDPAQARLLDSLIRANAEAIASRPLLLVDLRGNEGGGSFTSRALHPYIASADRKATPYDSGEAVMLSSPAQIAYARRFTGNDTSAFVRSLVARMEASPGKLVPMEETPAPPPASEPSVPGNWRVIVLVDGGTVSAAEVLVLRALRSSRATIVGGPTAGALDYQSVQIVSLGTGDRRWALGYPTITAHADLPARGMRGRGIPPQVRIDWSALADVIAEMERRFAP
jgi:hypothetical protein